jgi:anti-anti-sigma regulatory factor
MMAIQEWAQGIILAELPAEPDLVNELAILNKLASEKGGCHVVLDLGRISVFRPPVQRQLFGLDEQMGRLGRRLILCGSPATVEALFQAAGEDCCFEYAEDTATALAMLRQESR